MSKQLTKLELIQRSAVECLKIQSKVREFAYYLEWGPTVIDNKNLEMALEKFVWELSQEIHALEEDELAAIEEGSK